MNFILHIICVIAMTLPNILGFNLIFGKGKIFHFGPIGVSLIAAYASFLTLNATGSYLVAIAIGSTFALLASALFAWLSFRLDPDGLGILSIAAHLAIINVVLNWSSFTGGAMGIPKIPRMPYLDSLPTFTITVSTIAICWIIFLFVLEHSAFGRQLQALAEHEWYAKALGINRIRIHMIAFFIGGIGALLTNIFYHQYIHLVYLSDFGYPVFIYFVMIVVAGRPGSVLGVTLSTILIVTLKEAVRFIPLPSHILGPVRLLIFGVILLAAVWVQRDSLFPKKRTI
ncbi:branched-chain amino acid ABC transporter permease [Candidatus Peribacteria bacterium]|nr:branched-chain amino acid ABC transporter permease [Candidatus Peribacteria bacterium]